MSTTRINPRQRKDGKFAVEVYFAGQGTGIGSSYGRRFRKIYTLEQVNRVITAQQDWDEVYLGHRLLGPEEAIKS